MTKLGAGQDDRNPLFRLGRPDVTPIDIPHCLVPRSGIEPASPAYKTGPHPLKVSRANCLVPRDRIELPYLTCKESILPLN